MKTEEEELKKKLKVNKIIMVLCLVILLIVLCLVLFKIFRLKNVEENNDSNMGLATQSDNLVFYYDYTKGLVKKEKDNKKILTEDQAYSINYFDGKVYYTTPNSTGGINIKRVDSDGKNETVLLTTTSNSTKMYLQDSNIYYLTSNPDTISKIDLEGKNEEALLQRSIVDFKVVNGTIYFSDIMGFLYSIDTSGENYKTICEESLFSKFQILGKNVYYYDNENSKLMKANLDNISKKAEVTNKLDCDIFNVTSNGIYYLDKSESKIKFIASNGKKEKDIAKVNTDNTKINIVGSTIYYIDSKDGKTITKAIGTNGKQVK